MHNILSEIYSDEQKSVQRLLSSATQRAARAYGNDALRRTYLAR